MTRRETCRLAAVCFLVLTVALSGAAFAETARIADGLTLTMFTSLDPRTAATRTNHAEVPAYQRAAEITGINMRFLHPPAGQEEEQFNLMLASGELADIIYWGWLNFPGGPERAIREGYIRPLNELILEHAPNFRQYLRENPDVARDVITDSGQLYVFPLVRHDEWQRFFYGPQIRKDWLDAVGHDVPKTIDDWTEVLRAFKAYNPSGRQDAYPLVSQQLGRLHWFTAAWGMAYDFYVVDGQVRYGAVEPQFREFLETMRQWYSEGLLDPDFMATDYARLTALVTGDRAGAFWGTLNADMGGWSGLATNPNFALVGAPWPHTSDGRSFNFHREAAHGYPGAGAAISTTNKHPVESVKWLDFWWSEEGHILANFGFEGLTFNWVDGFPQFTDEILNNPDGLPPVQAIAKYTLAGAGGRAHKQDGRYYQQMMAFPWQMPAAETWAQSSTERVLPPVTPTPQESRRLAQLLSEINTYRDETVARFIMGRIPLSQFDNYIAQMEAMGIREAIAIYQAALDRYYAREVPEF